MYYDGWNLIQECDASGGEIARYIHGTRVDELVGRITPVGTSYYHHDALGSTIALSDGTGNVTERYSYDVFGAPVFKDGAGNTVSSSASGNRFLFTGREYIQQIALYDYRNRFYSPEFGRFLQTDPLRFAGKDMNIYRYVGNGVVSGRDPTGLCDDDGDTGGDDPFTLDITTGISSPLPTLPEEPLPPPPEAGGSDNTSGGADVSNSGAGTGTAIGRATNLPIDTTYTDNGHANPNGIYITHFGPGTNIGGWDPDNDTGTNRGVGNHENPLDDNSLAISQSLARDSGLHVGDPVYINGQYIGNYDDTPRDPGRVDVYDRNNSVNNVYWSGMYWGATISNHP